MTNQDNDTNEARSVPMLDAPDRIPREPCQALTPIDYFALTDHSQDASLLGDDWGLAETEIETIDKDGFELYGTTWNAKELVPFTTGDEKAARPTAARPTFVARYDAALAARGVLREVKILRKLSTGEYKPFCIAEPTHKLKTSVASREEFLAYRDAFLNLQKSKRGFNLREAQLLENREAELRALWDEQDAHASRPTRGDREVSAQPIFGFDQSSSGPDNRMARALHDVAQENESSPDQGEGGVEPSSSSTSANAQENRRDLGTALGGTEGFATEDE